MEGPGKTDWGDLLPDSLLPDSGAEHGNEQPKQLDMHDWLRRLDLIQPEIGRLCGHIEAAISVAFSRQSSRGKCFDDSDGLGVYSCGSGGDAELSTFPLGRVVSCTTLAALAYEEAESGELWFELGSSSLPRIVQRGEEYLTLHDSLPSDCSFSKIPIEWKVWEYVKGEHLEKSLYDNQLERANLYSGALEICERAPSGVTDGTGGSSGLNDWPSALFYFALKRIHPLLTARVVPVWPGATEVELGKTKRSVRKSKARPGAHVPFDGSFDTCNRYMIHISPSNVQTATNYVFDAFRQIAARVPALPTAPPMPVTIEQLPGNVETPRSVAQSESGRVVLYDQKTRPVVDGVTVRPLTKAQYNVVLKIVSAKGLAPTKDELEGTHGGARKTLYNLARKDHWKDVIRLPGKERRGQGYRIL